MLIGIFLLFIGVLMFLDELGVIHYRFGDYILPIALIAVGISIIAGQRKKKSP
ncbi:MAG: hypothetical protein JSU74_05780 [Candidatus Zixiibacteriota bacterium]|nr:MAG: hypothetical protein JSU74_05780 [candidate division Zixibacteria bacterium]